MLFILLLFIFFNYYFYYFYYFVFLLYFIYLFTLYLFIYFYYSLILYVFRYYRILISTFATPQPLAARLAYIARLEITRWYVGARLWNYEASVLTPLHLTVYNGWYTRWPFLYIQTFERIERRSFASGCPSSLRRESALYRRKRSYSNKWRFSMQNIVVVK